MFDATVFRRMSRTLVLPCAMLLSSAALSQTGGQGAITGNVLDATGAAIPNASVIAINKATGVQTKRTASGDGVYALTPLLPGTYSVTITASGFSTVKQENVVVDALSSVGLNVTLKTGDVGEVVDVTSAPPALETTNATLGGTIENDVYAALPLILGGQQRDPTQFATLLPGAQQNPGGRAAIVGGTGQRVSELYIDGLPTTTASQQGDNRPIFNVVPLESIDQIKVVTSGFSAEYQGAGLQNYNLKSGGNQFHGSVFLYVRNTIFDAWSFASKGAVTSTVVNGVVTTVPSGKPVEHQTETGFAVGGPVKIPFLFNGHDKLFFYSTYDKFHGRNGANPVPSTVPDLLERQGNFSELPYAIYDPTTQAACTARSTNGPCRYQFGYGPGATAGPAGNPVLTGTANVIPAGEISPISQYQAKFLPQPLVAGYTNNFLAGVPTGYDNFLFSERVDYAISGKQTLAASYAQGQRHAVPYTGSPTGSVNVVPYIQTTLSTVTGNIVDLQHTYTFSPHLVNQAKYGFIYFGGPPVMSITGTTNSSVYGFAASGVTGLPAGQASMNAANLSFSGTNAPTSWVGNTPTTTNRSLTYEALDNIFLLKGKHSMNFGGQVQWLENNSDTADGPSTPTNIAFSINDTAQLTPVTGSTYVANTGYSYASFLLGAVGSSSVTQQAFSIVGGRFRPAALYFQDDYKVTPKLTLNVGLRWDYIPPYHETLDRWSFLNPSLTNSITGSLGELQFAGNRGAGVSCQCTTPVQTYYKNFEPRLGFAYAADEKTVFRGGYSLNYSHGGGTGGAAGSGTGTGQAGFNTGLSFADSTAGPAFYLNNNPAFSAQNTTYGGAGYVLPGTSPVSATTQTQGTGFYTTSAGASGGNGTGINYADPVISGRAPEFSFFSFGMQREVTKNLTVSVDYSGSQSHFISGASNIRGFYAGQLDPKYLVLGSYLSMTATAAHLAAATAATGIQLTAPYAGYTAAAGVNSNATIAHMLTWMPQYAGTTDYWGNYVANGNYNSMQIAVAERATHGLTFNINYTYSQTIDDAGTQRSGYAIPATAIASGVAYPKNRIDRSISINDQPQNLSIYGVYTSQYGKGSRLGDPFPTRALLSGWQTSFIYQYASGLPLPIVGTCNSTQNVGQGTCMPDLNPTYVNSGQSPRINGKFGSGVTAATLGTKSYLAGYIPVTTSSYGAGAASATGAATAVACATSTGPFCNSGNYTIGDAPRFPFGLRGPGNYRLNMSLRRNFALTERLHFIFGIDGFNLLNSVTFGNNAGNNQVGVNVNSSSFGTLGFASADPRDFQFSGRIQF